MKTWNGSEIKELRKKLGVTQLQIANALLIRTATISDAENGKTAMSKSTLLFFEMLDKGDITVNQLLDYSKGNG